VEKIQLKTPRTTIKIILLPCQFWWTLLPLESGHEAFFVCKGRSRSKVREIVDTSPEIQVHNDMRCEISFLGAFLLPPMIPENKVVGNTNILGKIEVNFSFDNDGQKY
jgi:hypothetical protein